VFGVAGLAKLADRDGSRRALVDFGVPNTLAVPLAIVLPLAELVVAVSLLPVATAWYGAVGALALLLLFVVAIAVNLARGRKPDCHCFGQLSSAPAGRTTLARNAVLALVGGFVVWQARDNPGLSPLAWFYDLSVAQRVLLAVGLVGLALVAAEGWVLLQMLRQQGRLLLRLDTLEAKLTSVTGITPASANPQEEPVAGLLIGTPAPTFRIKGLHGEKLTLESLLAAGKPLLLFFTHPGCGPCQALMPDISRNQHQHVSSLTIALISEGTLEENREMTDEYGVTQVLLQKKREVAEAYEAYGTPSAVLVRSDGIIGSPLAMGADAVRALVLQASSMAMPAVLAAPPAFPQDGGNGNEGSVMHHPSPPEIGQPAPPLKLQDLRGKTINLHSFRGSETLLLFWNPGCGFCQQMLDDLKVWEASPQSGAPKLLVVSTGTVEDNLAMNLRSTVLLDPNFVAGPAFGAGGTPMAVLLDAKGRIASEVAAGAHAVFELASVTANDATKAP